MTQQNEKVILKAIHNWVATTIAVCVFVWGIMAYYVNSENTETRLVLQSQISVLQEQARTSTRVNQLVLEVDKKLSNIETSLTFQSKLIVEVQSLREEVNKLKVEIARQHK